MRDWTYTVPICGSSGNNIETKAERSFDLGFVFHIEAKRTCLFQNFERSKRSEQPFVQRFERSKQTE